MTFKPSEAQQAFYDCVENESCSVILEAVAGSGKTTTLIHGLHLMKGRVFLGAYNKTMADELKEKIGRKDGVFIATFHSAGFAALRRRFDGIRVDGDKVIKIARGIADKHDRDDLRELAPIVSRLVSMAKNIGIGALKDVPDTMRTWMNMAEHFGLDQGLPEDEEGERKAIMFAQRVLAMSNHDTAVCDFDDMVYLALYKNCRMYTHDYVLVDEAQDTNPVRLELATRMLARNGRMFAVGDRYQAIYGFSGALSNALELIEERFNAKVLPLSTTYRCPKAVVEQAQEIVPHIVAHESAPEGSYTSIPDTEVVDAIRMFKPSHTGILCRYNKQLVQFAFKLLREDVPCYIEGRAIGVGLLKKWKITSIRAFKAKLLDYQEKEIAKALEADKEEVADRIEDECETLLACIDRALEKDLTHMTELRSMITDLFNSKTGYCLSSVHRSKGLEWDHVFILYRDELMPAKFARKDWQLQQEHNLEYVALTRSKKDLIDVYTAPEED